MTTITTRQTATDAPGKPDAVHGDTQQIHRVAGYAFLLNLVLGSMKTLLAFYSGSLAITASAIDSGTDAVASLVIYAGVKLSSRKTRSFPMGLYKLENVASVVIAIFIFIAGYEIVREIFTPMETRPQIDMIYLVLLLLGTAATFGFGQYAIAAGRRTGSPTLIAEGRHRQVDVLSSLVVLASAALSYFDVQWSLKGVTIDQIGAGLILVFIVRAGWALLSDGMRVLLDASIEPATLNTIRDIIKSEPMVGDVSSLIGRNAGRFRFIQAVITLKTENLEKAHQISQTVESKIREQVSNIERVFIHYEPQKRLFDNIALPLDDRQGAISAHFGEAPYFAIIQVRREDNTVESHKIVENPHRLVETAKGIRAAEWLIQMAVNHVGIKEDVSKKGPGYVLSNGGVTTHLISAVRLSDAVSEILSKQH